MINVLKKITNLDEHSKEVFLKSSSTVVIQVIGILARLLTSIFLGRTLGAAGLGDVNLINQIITIIMVFSMFGMDHVIVKKTAIGYGVNDFKLIGSSLFTALRVNILIAIILTILGVLSSSFISQIFNNPQLQTPIIIVFLVIVPQTIGNVFSSSVNGYSKVWQSRLLKDFLTSLIVFIGVCLYWLLNIKVSLYSVILLYVVGRFITFIAATIYWKSLYKPIFFKSAFDWSMLKMSVPLLFVSATTLLSSSIDVLMLGWLSGSEKVGLYTVAARLVLFIAFFLQITNSAISPKIATFHSNKNFTEMSVMVKKVTFWLIIIGLLSTLFFAIFGKPILGFWGDGFKEAYACLIILCIGQFVNVSTGCSGVLLIMCGHEKIFSYISTSFLVLNVILNYFLIIEYQEIGAAIATTIAIVGENIVRVVVVKYKTGILTFPSGRN
jgi:O-antigen/teichoic acid export membrane protein